MSVKVVRPSAKSIRNIFASISSIFAIGCKIPVPSHYSIDGGKPLFNN